MSQQQVCGFALGDLTTQVNLNQLMEFDSGSLAICVFFTLGRQYSCIQTVSDLWGCCYM